MRTIKPIGILLIILFFISACGGSFNRPGDDQSGNVSPKKKGRFDPLSLPQDKRIIPEDYPIIAAVDSQIVDDTTYFASTDDSSSIIPANPYETFRIQLYTSKSYGPAITEQKIAAEVFDQVVFLDYEVPYYKVRCGDFPNTEEAEKYLPAAIEAGYRNAWVVKVAKNVHNLKDLYEDEEIRPLIDTLIDTTDSLLFEPENSNDQPEYPEN